MMRASTFFLLGVLSLIHLDTMTWSGPQWWSTGWHITHHAQLLFQCFICGLHRLPQIHALGETWCEVTGQEKVPCCAERSRACSGREWDVSLLSESHLVCEIWYVCTKGAIMQQNIVGDVFLEWVRGEWWCLHRQFCHFLSLIPAFEWQL